MYIALREDMNEPSITIKESEYKNFLRHIGVKPSKKNVKKMKSFRECPVDLPKLIDDITNVHSLTGISQELSFDMIQNIKRNSNRIEKIEAFLVI